MFNSGRPSTIPDLIPATSGPHLNLPWQFSLHSTLPPPNFYFPSTLPFSYFSPISSTDQTHLLHLWRPFWARYKKTSRCGIPSSLIWCFSVTKISNRKRSSPSFSHYQTIRNLWRVVDAVTSTTRDLLHSRQRIALSLGHQFNVHLMLIW